MKAKDGIDKVIYSLIDKSHLGNERQYNTGVLLNEDRALQWTSILAQISSTQTSLLDSNLSK